MNHWVFLPSGPVPPLLLPSDPGRNSHRRFQFYWTDMFPLPADCDYRQSFSGVWSSVTHSTHIASVIVFGVWSNDWQQKWSDRNFQCVFIFIWLLYSLVWSSSGDNFINSFIVWAQNICGTHIITHLTVSHSFTLSASSSFLFHFLFFVVLTVF